MILTTTICYLFLFLSSSHLLPATQVGSFNNNVLTGSTSDAYVNSLVNRIRGIQQEFVSNPSSNSGSPAKTFGGSFRSLNPASDQDN